MNVLMTGGTGFLGSALRNRLESDGHTVTVLSRSKEGKVGQSTFCSYDSLMEIGPHDAVINLAGESVAGLWTSGKRKAIYDSRIDTTREIAEWIDAQKEKPRVFLSGSAIGIYGDRGDEALTEKTDVSRSEGFLAKVCRDWEQAAGPAAWKGTRTVFLRTGHVFDPSGGFLGALLPILRRLPIVVLGHRGAFLPWIALSDWIGVAMFALTDERVQGPLNLTAPNPATQEEFTRAAASYLGKRVWGRVPEWMIRLGAGEFGESLTASQRVLPAKALDLGYEFEETSVDGYFADIKGSRA